MVFDGILIHFIPQLTAWTSRDAEEFIFFISGKLDML